MADNIRTLQQEKVAAIRLIRRLTDEGEADDQEIVDTAVEGETNFVEAVAAVIAEIDECEILETGIKAKQTELGDRLASIEKRSEHLRGALEAAMVEAGQQTIRLPTRTLFLSKRAPNIVIENEAEIPSRFWTQPAAPAPKLDRKTLKAALAAKEAVPGAKLDNGSITLSMRK